jgi:hypothetical protein
MTVVSCCSFVYITVRCSWTGAAALILASLAGLFTPCVGAGWQKGGIRVADQNGVNQAAEEQISKWLEVVWSVGPREYAEIKDYRGLPNGARVEHDSIFWAGKFFTSAANPYEPKRMVRRSIHHATPEDFDIVRHEYEALGRPLILEETANYILLTVDTPFDESAARTEQAKQDEINQLAASVLKMSGTMVAYNLQPVAYLWVFRFPPKIREGARFSTDPSQDPRSMWSWAFRVDGGIHQNRVYFLLFKIREATSGQTLLPDPQHWFDGLGRVPLKRRRR